MNVTIKCEAGHLVAAMKGITAVSRRSDLSITSDVLIDVREDGAYLTGTAVDHEITVFAADFDTKGVGSCSIDATRLAALAGGFNPGAVIMLAFDPDKSFTLKSGRSNYTFALRPANEFPRLTFEFPKPVRVEASFVQALMAVRHAASREQAKWYINGVALHAQDGKIDAMATDTNQMAVRSFASDPVGDIVIPSAVVDLIARIYDDAALIDLSVTSSAMRFAFGRTVVVGKAIDSPIQKYRELLARLAAGATMSVDLPRVELIGAVSRLMSITSDKARGVKIDISSDKIGIANDAGHEEVACEASGEVKIGFSSRLLYDAISGLDGDIVTISIVDPQTPAVLSSASDPDTVMLIGAYNI